MLTRELLAFSCLGNLFSDFARNPHFVKCALESCFLTNQQILHSRCDSRSHGGPGVQGSQGTLGASESTGGAGSQGAGPQGVQGHGASGSWATGSHGAGVAETMGGTRSPGAILFLWAAGAVPLCSLALAFGRAWREQPGEDVWLMAPGSFWVPCSDHPSLLCAQRHSIPNTPTAHTSAAQGAPQETSGPTHRSKHDLRTNPT